MKKSIRIIAALLALILVLGGCGSKVDKNLITETINRIDAGEVNYAFNKMQEMNKETLLSAEKEIFGKIVENLNEYLNTNWVSSRTCLIDAKVITELKVYKGMIELMSLEDVSTNALDFINRALKLDKYREWNSFYVEMDNDSFTEMIEYTNLGSRYKNLSWDAATGYYADAYDVAMNAYQRCAYKYEKGMYEAAEMFKAFATVIEKTIYRQEISQIDSNNYDTAMAEYKRVLGEYDAVISEVIDIIEGFPKKIY